MRKDHHVRGRNLTAAGAAAGAILIMACQSSTEPVVLAWEGPLIATTSADIAGSVAVVSQNGRTTASLLVETAESGTRYEWRINEGTCSDEGDLIGGAAVYPDVTTSASGSASGETSFAELLRAGGRYATRLALPGAGGSATTVACGELERVR